MDLPDPSTIQYPADIEQFSAAPDGRGGRTRTWSRVAHVYISDEASPMSVVSGAGTMLTATRHKCYMRFQPNITIGMRVNTGTAQYSIQSVIDVNRARRFLLLTCVEVMSGGEKAIE